MPEIDKQSVFGHKSYKAYLKAWIHARPSRGHGEKRKFAEVLKCNSAYVSQVLEKDADFSLEQAVSLSAYLGHNELEQTYFLLLVQEARAGNQALLQHVRKQREKILADRLILQHRAEHRAELNTESLATYFSSWHYAAAHVSLLLPKLRTREALTERLRLPVAKVAEILSFLVENGLAREEGGKFHYGTVRIFVPDSSPLAAKSHANWRIKAMSSLDQLRDVDLHYSSVAAVNARDVPRIREVLVQAVESVREIVKESKDEDTLLAYTLDLFEP